MQACNCACLPRASNATKALPSVPVLAPNPGAPRISFALPANHHAFGPRHKAPPRSTISALHATLRFS
jgi:hypothetical protein